jgi:hypothetical protein
MSQMKKTRRPVDLTVKGKAGLVVQDAESYRQIPDRLERFEAVEAIRPGMAAAGEGRSSPRGRRWQSPTKSLAFQVDITEAALDDATPRTTFDSSVTSKSATSGVHDPQHFLYFLPLPHGQGSFLPVLGVDIFT